ncbi:IS110 family transposase, partial [Rhizobium tibeticum]|uniref:IS110 family transposase n=1 Tax=Rhizobium tibeticum TaxID=501024 RepID=UPI0011600F6C
MAKTDRVDAELLARYGLLLDPRLLRKNTHVLNDLKELHVARLALLKDRTAAKNRAKNLTQLLLKRQNDVRLRQLEAESCLDPDRIYKMALDRQHEGKIVFVDIEGTTNENLFAGLCCADIVLIPLQTTQDDVVAGMQLALNHIPVVEEDQKRKLPALIVINQHDL